jgi:hypothetical protein
MQRLSSFAVVVITALFALLAFAPVALADDPVTRTDGALMAFGEDVTLAVDQQTDLVLVINGTATVSGDAKVVIAIAGEAILEGATVETVVAVDSPVQVATGSAVTGDIVTIDTGTVSVASGATVAGEVRDVTPQLIGLGAFLAPAVLLVFLGFVLVTFAAGLALAGLAARQVRAAETLISQEPGPVLVAGLLGVFLPLLLIAALFVTVVGIPLGIALLVGVWPLTAYLGYLVAGIWIGDWVLARTSPERTRERPYLASVIGLLIMQVLSILPPVTAIASLFGYGAVILLAWRVFRGTPSAAAPAVQGPSPAPMAG